MDVGWRCVTAKDDDVQANIVLDSYVIHVGRRMLRVIRMIDDIFRTINRIDKGLQ